MSDTVLRRRPPPPPAPPVLRRRPDGSIYLAPPEAAVRSTTTPTLGLIKPVVGADENVWGNYLNANADQLDATVLPLAGGTMTGPLISYARISVTGAPITTDNTMLCHHLSAGIRGAAVGGFVGSWDEIDNTYAGFYCDAAGNIIFASADPALGTVNPTDPRAAINPDGSMQVYKDLAVSGGLVVSGGDLQVGNSHSITTAGTMLCGHLAVGRAGDSVGGFVGSWNVVRTGYTGFWTAADGTMNFGTADPALGTIIGTRATLGSDGTFTPAGPVALPGNPTAPLHAAPKQWVEAGFVPEAPAGGGLYGRRAGGWGAVLPLGGGTLTGALTLYGDPTLPSHAATMQWVNAQIGSVAGITEAPKDGKSYGRTNGTWAATLPLAGGTLTGPVTLAADPAAPLQPATKQYADDKAAAALPLAGGTLTGPLTLAADPAAPLQPATKQYADAKAAAALPLAGGTLTGPLALQPAAGGYPTIVLNKTAASVSAQIVAQKNGLARWVLGLGNESTETGSNNVGSDFALSRCTDAGAFITSPLLISRSTGDATFSNNVSSSASITAGGNILAVGGVFGTAGLFAGGGTDFGLTQNGNSRTLHWAGNYADQLDVGNGLRNWIRYDGTQTMGLAVDGTLTVLKGVNAPRFGGGYGGGGTLTAVNGNNGVNFDWAPNNQLAYRVDDQLVRYICTADNAAHLGLASGGGGPVGVALNLNDFSSGFYGIFCDAASDARIKRNVAPTAIDALAALQGVEVAQFDVDAAAIAAIQPVPEDEKAALREAGDAHVPIGLVAQQVQRFLPELVNIVAQPEGHDPALPDDMHYLVLQNAVPYLIRAVQQLAARVEALEGAVLG